jgi:hypothetical protein
LVLLEIYLGNSDELFRVPHEKHRIYRCAYFGKKFLLQNTYFFVLKRNQVLRLVNNCEKKIALEIGGFCHLFNFKAEVKIRQKTGPQ